jgi:hypothetical protein
MNLLERVIIEPFERFYERIIEFLPNLLTALLLAALGIAAGALLRYAAVRVFRALGMDKLSERSGMPEVLKKGGITEPVSAIMSRLIGWFTVFVFLVMALRSLDVPVIEQIFARFILYLPNIFVAAAILVCGYFLANFMGRAALIASVNAGFKMSGTAGRLVKLAIIILAVTMSLEQLGIGRETMVIAFAIIFGGIVLALAIAFGLGGRDIAKNYLEKKITKKGEEEKDEIQHL